MVFEGKEQSLPCFPGFLIGGGSCWGGMEEASRDQVQNGIRALNS